MSTYRGYEGMWATFDYDGGPYLMKTYKDVTDAARECSAQGYGNVVFLRQDMLFQQSIEWYLAADGRKEEWAKLRLTILHAKELAIQGEATFDQELDIVTNQIWMNYLDHETGMGPCVSAKNDKTLDSESPNSR